MDELPSAAFRKTYAKLTQPTIVTVNGHPIGEWVPRGHLRVRAELHDPAGELAGLRPDGEGHTRPGPIAPGFNTRPFTPVPKR